MAIIRNTNVQSTPRISMSRSALLATMGDQTHANARVVKLGQGLNTAYWVSDASSARYATDASTAARDLRDRVCRLRYRLLHARTLARAGEITAAQSTVNQIVGTWNPVG